MCAEDGEILCGAFGKGVLVFKKRHKKDTVPFRLHHIVLSANDDLNSDTAVR